MNFRNFSVAVAGVLAGAAFASAARRRTRRIGFSGLSVLVTGGSRGLGLEMARLFAAEGASIALLARDEDELRRAKRELAAGGTDVLVFTCDVGSREQVDKAVRNVIEARGRVDVLVNNAGIVQIAPYESFDIADFEAAMAVHAWGTLHTVLAVVPYMKRQGGGRIVNISSIGGLVAVPHLLPYSMSKFALTGLSEGLRTELLKDGIRVTTVAPGLMRTGSHVNAFFKGQFRKEYAWFTVADANPLLSASSRRAAREIIDACRYGDPFLVITLPAKLLFLANALLPAVSAAGLAAVNRLLPSPAEDDGKELHRGSDCRSSLVPPFLTRLADRMIVPNNETVV